MSMSVNIKFDHILKKYGEQTVIPDINLTVKEGEFFTLLGPSGCGKTTLLRMIIGFNSIEGGHIYFNEHCINDVPPNKRNIGMVFQNYAVFPHMTVAENVAFGLTNRKVNKDEIKKRVAEILKIVQIDNLKDRLPRNMSGGQQQRIALARAIVVNPDVLLMDEPLSNLDAKLRVEMRTVIKNIQREVGITTVYVTHDQEEALAVSDRIAIMNKGHICQVDTPRNIYQRPANIFVATFIGLSNIIPGTIQECADKIEIELLDGYKFNIAHFTLPEDNNVKVSIRPEEFIVVNDNDEGLVAEITDAVFLGMHTHYHAKLTNGQEIEFIDDKCSDNISSGLKVKLQINTAKVNIFTADGNCNLLTQKEVTKC